MTGRRRYQGLAARFFLAQLLVVGASVLAAVVVASLAGPPLFHEHLEQAGAGHDAAQMLHVEQAYRDANFWTLGVALATPWTVSPHSWPILATMTRFLSDPW